MPKIIVTQPFKFAHLGYQVEEFTPGQEPVDTSDECAALAVQEGWARWPQAAAGEATAAVSSAPENKDAARRRTTKAAP